MGPREAFEQIAEFLIHVLVGSAMAIILAVPALLLDYALGMLKANGLGSPLVLNILSLVKIGILVIDSFLVLVFLGRVAYRASGLDLGPCVNRAIGARAAGR